MNAEHEHSNFLRENALEATTQPAQDVAALVAVLNKWAKHYQGNVAGDLKMAATALTALSAQFQQERARREKVESEGAGWKHQCEALQSLARKLDDKASEFDRHDAALKGIDRRMGCNHTEKGEPESTERCVCHTLRALEDERDTLAAKLAEAESSYSNFREECRAYRDKLGAAMNGSTGAFETIVNWAVEELNAIPKLIEQRDAAIARAEAAEAELAEVVERWQTASTLIGVPTGDPSTITPEILESFMRAATRKAQDADDAREQLMHAPLDPSCPAEDGTLLSSARNLVTHARAMRAELAALGPVERECNCHGPNTWMSCTAQHPQCKYDKRAIRRVTGGAQ